MDRSKRKARRQPFQTTPEGVVLTHHASWIVAPATKLPSNCIPAPTGTLVLSKSCFVTGIDSSLGIHVHFTGSVTNNASVQVSSIAVTDAPEGESGTAVTLSATTLAPGGVATFSGDYLAVTCTPINSTG